jgi:TRAP-type C4-dicarboxylate transport system substrate-binding protein
MNFKRTLLVAALPLMFFAGAAQALELKFADIHPAGYPTVVAEETWARPWRRKPTAS